MARVSNNSINFSIETEQVGNDDGQLIIGGSSEKEDSNPTKFAFLRVISFSEISFQSKMELSGRGKNYIKIT